MSTGGEYNRDPAVTPQMARAIREMKARAQRLRSRQMWIMLGFVIVFVSAGAVVTARDMLPWLAPKYLLGGCVGIAAVLAQLLHPWQVRGMHPQCPNCGGAWQIRDLVNEGNFEEFGCCPHCRLPI